MRTRFFSVALIAISALALLAPGAGAKAKGPTAKPPLGTWYPKITLAGTRCSGKYLLTQDTKGTSDDGCGHTFGGSTYEWTEATPGLVDTIPAGTKVSGTIYVDTYQPDSITLKATLAGMSSDGSLDASAGDFQSASPTSAPGSFALSDAYVPVTFSGRTTAPIPKGDLLDLSVTLTVFQDNFLGYLKPHQSVLTLG